ncbi:MAG TPA: FmdE family protein [Edaphobacter sp.]
MQTFEALLGEAEVAHGHLCAGQILGVRMAMLGCQRLGIDDPKEDSWWQIDNQPRLMIWRNSFARKGGLAGERAAGCRLWLSPAIPLIAGGRRGTND